jgi:hypothetical protein
MHAVVRHVVERTETLHLFYRQREGFQSPDDNDRPTNPATKHYKLSRKTVPLRLSNKARNGLNKILEIMARFNVEI